MYAICRVRQFFATRAPRQGDVIAGDANAAAHKHYRKQPNNLPCNVRSPRSAATFSWSWSWCRTPSGLTFTKALHRFGSSTTQKSWRTLRFLSTGCQHSMLKPSTASSGVPVLDRSRRDKQDAPEAEVLKILMASPAWAESINVTPMLKHEL